jgi:tripartite ATP-independent transporter DctM subunit
MVMSSESLGLVSLASLFIFIFIGYPISLTLVFLGVVFGYIGFGKVVFYLLTYQFFGTMTETLLAAVPMFLFMGYVLERSGLMNRLFTGFQLLLAPVKGSLYLVVLAVATLFAAATGIVGAAVTILGVMAAPIMIKSGYSAQLSAGAIAAGGTLGMLIPPSVMLVVMGPVVGVPITELFAAAVIPGIMLSCLYAVYAVGRCYLNPSLGPVLPMDQRAESVGQIVRELFLGIMPLAFLIFSVLGSILAGLATPTDAAAMGALGSVVLAIAYRKLTWENLRSAVYATVVTSSMILLLVAASNFYGAVFARLGTATMIAQWLLDLQLPPAMMIAVILAAIFVLGWPLEWVPIVLIVIPIFLPIITKLGIDLVWFCTLVAICLQTAWLSPPVALSAYYIKGVVPEWDLKDIYKGMMQFMVIQVIGLILVFSFPQIALWLPQVLFRGGG